MMRFRDYAGITLVGLTIASPLLVLLVTEASKAAPSTPKPAPLGELTLVSPNGRFEIQFKATDDGAAITILDTVKKRMTVNEVTVENGSLIGIGEEPYIRNGAIQAGMRTDGGFVEWGRVNRDMVP